MLAGKVAVKASSVPSGWCSPPRLQIRRFRIGYRYDHAATVLGDFKLTEPGFKGIIQRSLVGILAAAGIYVSRASTATAVVW